MAVVDKRPSVSREKGQRVIDERREGRMKKETRRREELKRRGWRGEPTQVGRSERKL